MLETNKSRTACFTGHRNIAAREKPALLSALYAEVAGLAMDGIDTFICGGAVGFDTEAAECVLQMKERFSHIRLLLFLPCRDQTSRWNSVESLAKYKKILGGADGVSYVQNFYTDGCMLERNRQMVNASSVCIAYLKTTTGGTAYTVRYAEKQGLTVKNLAPRQDDGQINI